MTEFEANTIAAATVDAIKQALNYRVTPLEQRIAELERLDAAKDARILELEASAAARSKVDA